MTAVDTTIECLSVPDVSELDTLTAALTYAKAGWYVGPCYVGPDESRNKHPGSILAKGWQHKTSRDPKQIIAWFAGTTGVGVFLHCGRSGAVVFDVDTPDAMPDVLRDNLAWGPYQSTRPEVPGRGHYPFRMPPGRTLGNSGGKLGKAWGEVRGANGVIVVAPSPHVSGRYEWVSAGTVPVLPPVLAELLPDATPSVDAATDQAVSEFRARYDSGPRSELIGRLVDSFNAAVAEGGSRHEAMVSATCWAARNARAGVYEAGLAFDTLEHQFIAAMADGHAGPTDGSRTLDRPSAQSEFAGMVAWAVAQAVAEDDGRIAKIRAEFVGFTAPPPLDGHGATEPDAEQDIVPSEHRGLSDEFWQARPVFGHIRQAAHSRVRSADLVLIGVLTRLSAYVSHTYELPGVVGSPSSLNLYGVAVGPSGAGKSSGSTIADELLQRPEHAVDRPLGSGEGLAENYMGTVTEELDGKKRRERRQVRHNAFIYCDEGEAMVEMMGRTGATLGEALRRAWTSGTLGQANATEERTRVIPSGSYTLGLLVGFQPSLAGELLDDNLAGTPQRFLFAAATDPTIPREAVEWPGEIRLPSIPAALLAARRSTRKGMLRHTLELAPPIVTEVRDHAFAVQTAEVHVDELDAHRPLQLLKVAGLLAVLDGRLDVTEEDWGLSKMVWDASCRIREDLLAEVRRHRAVAEQNRLERHHVRALVEENARQDAQGERQRQEVSRLALNLAGWVHDQDGDVAAGHLRKRLRSNKRDRFDDAIEFAVAEGWLHELDEGERYASGEVDPR